MCVYNFLYEDPLFSLHRPADFYPSPHQWEDFLSWSIFAPSVNEE